MRFGIAFLCLLAICTNSIGSDTLGPKNGYWWEDRSESYKLAFVQGYVGAMSYARMMVGQGLNVNDQKLNRVGTEKPIVEYMDFSEVAYGQYMDGLTEFYKDYRNKRINVNIAILYIRDTARGESKNKLDARLEGMRQATTSPGYDDFF